MDEVPAEGKAKAAAGMARVGLGGSDTDKLFPPPSKPGIPALGDMLVAGSSHIFDWDVEAE